MSRFCPPGLAPFPPLESATEDGLLAVGGDLSAERLRCAYSLGIFPWFEPGQPILWWSPDPRCVLYPEKFRTSRSLHKRIRQEVFQLSFDRDFEAVIEACAEPRAGQRGTWITTEMKQAYTRLYRQGCAHSVEVWREGALVGGLYGVALGRIFYGESMFSRASDASKVALRALCRRLQAHNFELIDCQVESAHLLSLGAELIPRTRFVNEMQRALEYDEPLLHWT